MFSRCVRADALCGGTWWALNFTLIVLCCQKLSFLIIKKAKSSLFWQIHLNDHTIIGGLKTEELKISQLICLAAAGILLTSSFIICCFVIVLHPSIISLLLLPILFQLFIVLLLPVTWISKMRSWKERSLPSSLCRFTRLFGRCGMKMDLNTAITCGTATSWPASLPECGKTWVSDWISTWLGLGLARIVDVEATATRHAQWTPSPSSPLSSWPLLLSWWFLFSTVRNWLRGCFSLSTILWIPMCYLSIDHTLSK